jgi:hypothetical protein
MAQGFDGVTAEPQAAVMATSYRLQGDAAAARPVCFAFNGGPGSASLWLHLGALGPKRVVVPDDGSAARAVPVVDNPLTWLALRPGLHRPAAHRLVDHGQRGGAQAHAGRGRRRRGADRGDARLADAPPALGLAGLPGGESYGTTRGAALADTLQSQGVALSGLILISLRDGPADAGLQRRQ